MDFSNHKLVFVTGKGGVGKSACAAAIAWREARKGRRVCLAELGSHSFYEAFFETRGISYDPIEVMPDVHIALLKAEDCLKEYVLHYLRVPKLYDLFFQNRVMKAFLNAAPAVAEIAVLGKLTSDIRGIIRTEYDLFVVDCYSTGHALALLRAPTGVSAAIRAGPAYEQAMSMMKAIRDQQATNYVLVTVPEEMPVTEAREFHQTLVTEFNAQVHVVCSRIMIPPVTKEERKELLKEVRDSGLKRFVDYLDLKENQQNLQLRRVREFSPDFYGIPQILGSLKGQDYIENIAKHLDQPWTLTNS